jgi:uncharacterized membrane protein
MMFLFAWVMLIVTIFAWAQDGDWKLAAFIALFAMLSSIAFEVHRR